MYPPGLPMQFQKPIVEYKNEDEYGRLIKPCLCRGSLRYIHELCLLRSRTENSRKDSMWKCHECGHKFNFQKLTVQRWLSSKITVTSLTIVFMIFIVFLLGFIADPIINIYLDPYDSVIGHNAISDIWDELDVVTPGSRLVSPWWGHFTKGFISMGLVGFMKMLFLNPWQWINLRTSGSWVSGRANTGRNRAVNISWIAVAIGLATAFVVFYKWVEAIVQRQLQKLGNNIVDTNLPGDDDDLKPPAGWRYQEPAQESSADTSANASAGSAAGTSPETADTSFTADARDSKEERPQSNVASAPTSQTTTGDDPSQRTMSGSWISVDKTLDDQDSALAGAQRQGWSFANL